jgi:hypothetical protein
MQATAVGTVSASTTAAAIDVATSRPSGIRYYVVRVRVTTGSAVAVIPPGIASATAAGSCGEVIPSDGTVVQIGPYGYDSGGPYLKTASATATVAYTIYALTDEEP